MSTRTYLRRMMGDSLRDYFAPLTGAIKGIKAEMSRSSSGTEAADFRITVDGKEYLVVLKNRRPRLVPREAARGLSHAAVKRSRKSLKHAAR